LTQIVGCSILDSQKAATGPKLQVFGYWLLQETGEESLPEWILLQVSIFFAGISKNANFGK